MATTIEQQVAIDEVLVPSTQRLRIEKSNFRLPSDIQSKESTLQLIYDVLRICPFFKAFLVTADMPKIYMQEFWATANVHQHSIRFKMDNKKHILDLESFRNMLHICPRVLGQTFAELPFEEEIMHFIWFLGHSDTIRTLTDEDFLYQVKHKNHKKSNEMYYPRFTKVIIHHVKGSVHPKEKQELTNDEIRNTKAYKEYYDFATSEAAPKPKASAKRKMSGSDTSITPPTATTTPKPTVAVTPKLTAAAKGKQPAKATKAKSSSALSEIAMTEAEQLKLDEDDDEKDVGDDRKVGKEDDDEENDANERDDDDEDQEIAKDDEQDDTERSGDDSEEGESNEEDADEETRDEESFDHIPRTPKSSKDEGNGKENQGLNVNEEE
nr:hypothetical protein [Tanacetum cinerariifolium]